MWVARFRLRDDEDIYSPLCVKHKVEFFAYPYTNFIKENRINLLVGGTISGSEENKKRFVEGIRKDKRVRSIEQHHDFILVHAQHHLSREMKAEIRIFYDPEFVRVKPVHLDANGWEYWEVACMDRDKLNSLVNAAIKHYHGGLISIKKEKVKGVTSLSLIPKLAGKQLEAIKLAYKEGYYNYPRKITLPKISRIIKKSYSTFQENLTKAENKLIDYFLKNS